MMELDGWYWFKVFKKEVINASFIPGSQSKFKGKKS